eukprot:TCONS_00000137-protein
MVLCQAFGCSNKSSGSKAIKGKCFFKIPDPKKERDRCSRWLHNMGNAKLTINTFEAARHRVLCSDHFHSKCFERDLKAELCPLYNTNDGPARAKRLIDGAIPTIFDHQVYEQINMDGTTISSRQPRKRISDMERADVVKKLLVDYEQSIDKERIVNQENIEPSDTNDAPEETVNQNESPIEKEIVETSSDVRKTNEVGTQTEDILWPTSSSPIKNASQDSISQPDLSFVHDKDDPDYEPSVIENSNREEVKIDILNDEKFVVYEGMLDQLVSCLRCKVCALPVDEIKKIKLGTSIHYKIFCDNEHVIIDWMSQPLIGKMPAFNLLISASVFFSGSNFESIRKPVSFSGLNFVNANTFYKIQRVLVIPSVNQVFKQNIEEARAEIKTKADLEIVGDGRFDSPGKSAKYCTYTCQSPETKKIIATSTVQTSKGKGSAPLELEGFKNCLTDLESSGFKVKKIATDRNMQLAKWLRENRARIIRKYDTWHFSKNITSKLRKVSKRKGCKVIQEWI